tara:strand:- start:140 stop:484 length:345 start_codon:yes stop_codon:yes gene_type:complete
MEKFKIELDRRQITETVTAEIKESIKKGLEANKENISKSLNEYFKKGFFNDSGKNEFENQLDYTIEIATRAGLEIALEDLNYKQMIANKAKELLQTDDFLKQLAEDKIKKFLGL